MALLMTSEEPVTTAIAAQQLAVTRGAISKLAAAMQKRGDLERNLRAATRDYVYALTDDRYSSDLAERRETSRGIASACLRQLRQTARGGDNALAVRSRLTAQAAMHTSVAECISHELDAAKATGGS